MLTKKIIPFLLLLVIVTAAAGYFIYHEYNRKMADTADIKPAYALQTAELISSFGKSEPAANQQYSGKVIEVSGVIKSIDKDSSGAITVVLGDSSSLSSVRCGMTRKIQNESQILRTGNLITIKGVCTGYTADDMGLGSDVILSRCVISINKNQ